MQIQITIGGIDRTSIIEFGSVRKEDALNNSVDTLNFSITKTPAVSYTPNVNEEVVMTDLDTSEILFGGYIVQVDRKLDGHALLGYDIDCIDYAYGLDSQLVFERLENQSVQDTITYLIATYAPDFTSVNVGAADIVLDVVTFNRVTLSAALSTLAKQINYFWYVDYNKDVHFFAKNDEAAPFDITDSSANYIFDSLQVSTDFTQIRNNVIVEGGETESNSRTQLLSGTGTNKSFPLAYKFSSLPTILLNGVPQTVGVNGLDENQGFQVLWDYNQKNIEFDTAPPLGVENISVTGTPLLPLAVYVPDYDSIDTYGLREYRVSDKRIGTREDALAYGQAELDAYSEPLLEVRFQTYTSGLRSGQVITVNSALREVNEDLLISRVTFKMVTNSRGVWDVQCTSAREVTLTQILQEIFRDDDTDIDKLETIYGVREFADTFGITDSGANVNRQTTGPYYYSPPGGGNTAGTWSFSIWG